MSDTVRNNTETTVKNDTVATQLETVAWTPFDDDTERQPLRQVDFAKLSNNNDLAMPSDNTTTTFDSGCRTDDIATAERQNRPPTGVILPESDVRIVDWSKLSEKQFDAALQSVTSVEELSGVANRRRVLNQPNLPMWSEVQKSQILNRKFQLENENG